MLSLQTQCKCFNQDCSEVYSKFELAAAGGRNRLRRLSCGGGGKFFGLFRSMKPYVWENCLGPSRSRKYTQTNQEKVSLQVQNTWKILNMSQCCKIYRSSEPPTLRGKAPFRCSLDRLSYERVADLAGAAPHERHYTRCWFLDHDYKLPICAEYIQKYIQRSLQIAKLQHESWRHAFGWLSWSSLKAKLKHMQMKKSEYKN
jgi:hypothetical protein